MAVHFVQLTAIRQLWHAGRLDDYRLVWPSARQNIAVFGYAVVLPIAGGLMTRLFRAVSATDGAA
jgi:hypothetical protein